MAVSLNDVCSIYDVNNYFASDDKTVLQRLQGDRLIKQCGRCRFRRCRRQTVLYRNTDYKGNYAKYCKTCRKFENLTSGTLFEETHLGFRDIVMLAFLWCQNNSVTQIAKLTDLPKVTICRFHSYFQNTVSWKIRNDMINFTFGGSEEQIEITVVCKTKRKYAVGRLVPQKWVVVVYDTALRRGVVVPVEEKTRRHVLPVIQNHVRIGSVIHTKNSPIYYGLNRQGYVHRTVDPQAGVNINKVLLYWGKVKTYLRHSSVIKSTRMRQNLDTFIWQDTYCHDGEESFPVFLQHIRERYPV